MKFALSILPHDLSINDYYRKVKELRAKNQITLPVILKNERQINVFLRTEDIDLINVINEETLLQQPEERFAWLGQRKIGSDKTFLSSAPFAVMIGRLLSNY